MCHKQCMVLSLKVVELEEGKLYQQGNNILAAKLTCISLNKIKVLKLLKKELNYLMEKLITDNISRESF